MRSRYEKSLFVQMFGWQYSVWGGGHRHDPMGIQY